MQPYFENIPPNCGDGPDGPIPFIKYGERIQQNQLVIGAVGGIGLMGQCFPQRLEPGGSVGIIRCPLFGTQLADIVEGGVLIIMPHVLLDRGQIRSRQIQATGIGAPEVMG